MKVQPKPAYHARRQTIGWLCIGTATLLQEIADGLSRQDTNALFNSKEDLVWQTARNDLDTCEKRLRKLGKHLLGSNYGGR